MPLDMTVNLTPRQAADLINQEVVGGSMSAELIDSYAVGDAEGRECISLIYDKYYMRAGNRMTLTVIADNFSGATRVHCVSGGGGSGALFKFSWGADSSFEVSVSRALNNYLCR